MTQTPDSIDSSIRHIPLSPDGFAIVDADMFEELSKHRWQNNHGCAMRAGVVDGRKKTIKMHRVVIGAEDSQLVDHINRIRHDNRRANLRICTRSQNAHNQSKSKIPTSSKYKGVSLFAKRNVWIAKIGKPGNNSTRHLGVFKNEIAAALAYNKAAKEQFGDFACLNSISDEEAAIALAEENGPKIEAAIQLLGENGYTVLKAFEQKGDG